VRAAKQYLKENPQALILLLIVVVLGVGTVIALAFSTATNKSTGSQGFGVNDGAVLLRALF
jgi:hypothetical protein